MQSIISTIISIGLFVCILGILVFIHELGHFIAAKLIGAKVEEFALGLGMKIVGKKVGETEYKINLLPIGGYVKILGEDDKGSAKDERNLKNKTPLQRIFAMLAGVFMNFVLASVLYFTIFALTGYKFYLPSGFENFKPVLGNVSLEKLSDKVEYSGLVDELGAKKSGMPDKGEIKSVNNIDIEYSYQISEILSTLKGQTVQINACDTKCKIYDVEVSEQGKIGISLTPNYIYIIDYEKNKLTSGPAHGINMIRIMFSTIGNIFTQAKATGDYSEAVNTLSGPVGIYLAVDYVKQFGIISLLGLTADLSLVLSFMNLLPIPALDGGRVILIIPELITGKPLNPKLEAVLINVSFTLLLLLMLAIMVKDVVFFKSIQDLFR